MTVNKSTLSAVCLAAGLTILQAMVPPHPLYSNPPTLRPDRASQIFGPPGSGKSKTLPQSVLVLRVQFTDKQFISIPAYPDSLAHNTAFFERWMLHLTDFYADASHDAYHISYAVYPNVYTLNHTMAYYGQDTSERSDLRREQMVADLVQAADADIDFGDYDAIIVFHAGSGQESDINSIRTSELWSTFLSRPDFQEAFDPENDAYPGLATNDGVFVREAVLVPESEFQDYFPGPGQQNAEYYIFSLYGVLCHQFGHQIGLPTLFDNVSANGVSQGVGNWCLMGTGVWNANGNVPAQLSAWCRYYLGWETAQTITTNTTDLPLDYFLDHTAPAPRLYKLPISAREYFLIENRQQNTDNSIDPYNGQPSYTFNLLPPGEQDYYPDYPELPYFNFMENRYKGCEWDFFLPGLGGPVLPGEQFVTDGSGMLIWHIDENVINECFDAEFNNNHVNGDALHKGVDVEEADGIQHLDTGVFDYYKYGSPYDSFRPDNNSYFGDSTVPGDPNQLLHLPTSACYYGGIPLQVFDIDYVAVGAKRMKFSVTFLNFLGANYTGTNNLDACSVDFDNDGQNEIFYPQPNGDLYIWKDEQLMAGYPVTGLPDITKDYVWDSTAFYLPCELPNGNERTARAYRFTSSGVTQVFEQSSARNYWAASLVSADTRLLLPVNTCDPTTSLFSTASISIVNKATLAVEHTITLADSICTNLVCYQNKVYILGHASPEHTLTVYDMQTSATSQYPTCIPADSTIVAISAAILFPDADGDLVIQTPYSYYLIDLQGNTRDGYPKSLPFYSYSPVVISDSDGNGRLDMMFGGENSFAVMDYAGDNLLTMYDGITPTDTLKITSGILPINLDTDSQVEYLGAFSRNRLIAYDTNLRCMSGFPVSFGERSRHLPFIHRASDNKVYAWLATDNGNIYKALLPDQALSGLDPKWSCKYANLQRTASREDTNLPNAYLSNQTFVPQETYVFPNPLRTIYAPKLTFQIMTSQDAEVEVNIYDISGKKIHHQHVFCHAYLKNRGLVDLPVNRLSSGVYLAVFKAGKDIKRLKFAIEK